MVTLGTNVRRPDNYRKSWAATFPEDVSHLSESTIFITRCMYIAFSHILASRRLLPKNVFKRRVIDGDLRACVMDTSDVLGARIVQKFKGITHAIEHRYLRELMLVVSATEEDEKDAIEMYTWRLRYDVDGNPEAELRQADGTVMASLRFRGMQYLKKQVTELLLMIRTLCRDTLIPLPIGASGTLRITYTDRAPRGYQAPGFYRSPEDPVLRPEAQEIEIGALQTRYHGASVVVQSIFIDDAYAVGLRLKETMKLTSLDESFNEGEEQGAGDDGHNSSNDTMERISSGAAQQVDQESSHLENPRDEDTPLSAESRTSLHSKVANASQSSKTSMVEKRGSSINMDESDTSPEDMPAKRARRGRAAARKVPPSQPINERARSPVVVSIAPAMASVTTPTNRKHDDDAYDTPPAKRTPGEVKCSKFTPKEAPARRRR